MSILAVRLDEYQQIVVSTKRLDCAFPEVLCTRVRRKKPTSSTMAIRQLLRVAAHERVLATWTGKYHRVNRKRMPTADAQDKGLQSLPYTRAPRTMPSEV